MLSTRRKYPDCGSATCTSLARICPEVFSLGILGSSECSPGYKITTPVGQRTCGTCGSVNHLESAAPGQSYQKLITHHRDSRVMELLPGNTSTENCCYQLGYFPRDPNSKHPNKYFSFQRPTTPTFVYFNSKVLQKVS